MKRLIVVLSVLFCFSNLFCYEVNSRDLQFGVPYQEVIKQFENEGFTAEIAGNTITWKSVDATFYELPISTISCLFDEDNKVVAYYLGNLVSSYTEYLHTLILTLRNGMISIFTTDTDDKDRVIIQFIDKYSHVIKYSYLTGKGSSIYMVRITDLN